MEGNFLSYVAILVAINYWRLADPSTQRSQVQSVFTAAVYEHPVIMPQNTTIVVSRSAAVENMMKNLMHYQQHAEMAARQGVDVLVFPEYGIYGFIMTREAIQPYLEYVPDPKSVIWCPCMEPRRYERTEVLQFLSCLARNNSLYLVANFGDIQPCSKKKDPDCPTDGHYQYNTNVVFDKKGTLIARYHKETLYAEHQFNKPKTTEYIFFDTPFGRFGVFTCFDILFFDPAMRLVLEYNVTNIVFPTAWGDSLPFLAAIQFHSAFAGGNGVNLLGANIHLPSMRLHGSGIYTPNGAKTYYYDDKTDAGKLLIVDVPILNPNDLKFYRDRINQETLQTTTFQFSYDPTGEFSVSIRHDIYTFKAVSAINGTVTVCQKSLCCFLEYTGKNGTERFGFGVLDSIHRSRGDRNYYLQICALIKCDSPEPQTCEPPKKHSSTTFSQIKIRGNFSTGYIFPETLLADGDGLALLPIGDWRLISKSLHINKTKMPLLSASLLGRVYGNDTLNLHTTNKGTGKYNNQASNIIWEWWPQYALVFPIILRMSLYPFCSPVSFATP